MTEPHLSDSAAWVQAEAFMLDWLRDQRGIDLRQNIRITLASGATVAVDGVSYDPPILCEVYGRLGRVAGTTLAKVCQDAFKLVWLRDTHLAGARVILLIANAELEARLTQGKGWRVEMLRSNRVEVARADLSDDQLALIREAEKRARRGMTPEPEDDLT